MAKGFTNLFINSGVKDKSNVDLSRHHITTLDFGQIIPIFHEDLVPGDSYHVKGNYFARLAPLVVPTYGRFSFDTHTFFVPYHQVMDGSEAFFGGQNSHYAHALRLRYFTLDDIFWLFNFNSMFVLGTSDNYDIHYIDASGNNRYLRLSSEGRYYYKILKCLGYEIPRGIDRRPSSTWQTKMRLFKLNALPLLCFAHAYNSWMSQSSKFQSSQLSSLLYDIKRDVNSSDSQSNYLYNNGNITSYGLKLILDNIRLCFDSDYFTSMWESPNSPTSTLQSVQPDNTNIVISSFDTNLDVAGTLSQRSLDFLRGFDNWMRRNNYAGTRDVERIYSKFGIKIDDYKARYPYKLSSSSNIIQVGDVTCTGDYTDVPLGDYAGKGILSSQDSFDFKCNDYGMIITLGFVKVIPVYYQGFEHNVLRQGVFDFYNPEFDDLQAQPVSEMEICGVNKGSALGNHEDGTVVAGFVPRFSDYLYSRDQITGDMLHYQGMDAWHFGRDLNNLLDAGQVKGQNLSFCTYSNNTSVFDRIFSITDDEEDKFIFTMDFDVNAHRPMKSLSEKVDLGNGNLKIQRNGSQIS